MRLTQSVAHTTTVLPAVDTSTAATLSVDTSANTNPHVDLSTVATPRVSRIGMLGGVALAAVALLSLAGASSATVDRANVNLVSHYHVDDAFPWVADVWGYVDEAGREFALLCKGDGLLVIDCTNPSNPVLASSVPAPVTGSDMKDVKTWQHYAYACQEYGDIMIVDLSDPYNAVQVGEVPQSDLCYPSPCDFEPDGGAHNLFIDDLGRLFVAGVHFRSVLIYDLTADPTDPTLLHAYSNEYNHDIYAKGGRLYTCSPGGSENGFEIVNATNPTAPVVLGHFTYPGLGYAHSCWVTDDRQWILTGDESAGGHLLIWDASDPASVFPVAEYETGPGDNSIHNVQIHGDYAYLAYYEQGLRVLDISDPENPIEAGWYKDSAWDNVSCSFSIYRGIWGVYAQQPSRNIYVSEMCGAGLYVLEYTGETAGVETAPSDKLALQALPNPASAAVQLEARLEAEGAIDLTIYDATGRAVRTLAQSEWRAAGEWRWSWDRLDDAGRESPAGVYYARLHQERRTLTRKVVLTD